MLMLILSVAFCMQPVALETAPNGGDWCPHCGNEGAGRMITTVGAWHTEQIVVCTHGFTNYTDYTESRTITTEINCEFCGKQIARTVKTERQRRCAKTGNCYPM